MIYTQYGTEVSRVIQILEDTGDVQVQLKGEDEKRHYHLSQLKADGGIHEILAAAERTTKTIRRQLQERA